MLMIDFINVGYGDAVLIREHEKGEKPFHMLIDCGDISTGPEEIASKRIKAADFLRKNGVTQLDLLVLSHLHLDHTGGLTDLVPNVKINELWSNYVPAQENWGKRLQISDSISPGAGCLITSMNVYSTALKQMTESGTTIRCVQASAGRKLFCNGRLELECFCEEVSFYQRQQEILGKTFAGSVSGAELCELDQFINNTSIRLRITYGRKTIELPGDISAARWELNMPKPCTIVKLPHHGHKDSLSESLLSALCPEYVVISVSNFRNDDCPSHIIVDMLQQKNVKFMYTDAVALGSCAPVYLDSVKFIWSYES